MNNRYRKINRSTFRERKHKRNTNPMKNTNNQVCKYHLFGTCKNSNCCKHHVKEERHICTWYLSNNCTNSNCRFLHLKLIYVICSYHKNGYCRNGDKCNHIHPKSTRPIPKPVKATKNVQPVKPAKKIQLHVLMKKPVNIKRQEFYESNFSWGDITIEHFL
jgi:hypothetical protein